MAERAARIAVVVGTRPEAIKLAPIVLEYRKSAAAEDVLLVSTGQHREILASALGAFELTPDVDLGIMRAGQDLFDVTSAALAGLRDVFRRYRPSWVVVQGDTTTAFAAALAGFYERIAVAHVEAGLRTHQIYSPFPEEMNRRLIDQLSTLHLAPTQSAAEALYREGFSSSVHVTGNTVVDAALSIRSSLASHRPVIEGLPPDLFDHGRVLLVTAHRRESFGPAIAGICDALQSLADAFADLSIVVAVHPNPQVNAPMRQRLDGKQRIHLIPPQPYREFADLLDRSYLVLTDSGGIQEEAPLFGKPVLVMRAVTERNEGIEAGVAKLVGTDPDAIVADVSRLLTNAQAYADMRVHAENLYGDGNSAKRIVALLDQTATSSV